MIRLTTKRIAALLLAAAAMLWGASANAAEQMLVHMKTGLKHDDAQICVAYNVIWAGLKSGMEVEVLVDADAANTFKKGGFSGEDDIQGYKIPENLRREMATQFSIAESETPKTYGEYLQILHADGAKFYINSAFLVVSGIAPNPRENLGKISDYAAEIFKPVSLLEMIEIRRRADYYFVY